MTVIVLAKVKRSATARLTNPTGLRVEKLGNCACLDLVKGKKKRKKLRGNIKAYLAWLDQKVPSLSDAIAAFFKEEAERVAAALAQEYGLNKVMKAKKPQELKWEVLYGILNDALVEAYRENATQALADVGVRADPAIVALLDEAALEYAETRSAQLVGMRRTKRGKLVPNPNPKYAVSELTREGLRDTIATAVEEGWSAQDLADEIVDSYEFSAARAQTIARTELAFAHTEGNMAGWKESGVVEKKQSILGSEHDMDDVCDDNASAGAIPIDEPFPSGHMLPPYHPNCVCDVIPVLAEE